MNLLKIMEMFCGLQTRGKTGKIKYKFQMQIETFVLTVDSC